jgi:hypothetical protein
VVNFRATRLRCTWMNRMCRSMSPRCNEGSSPRPGAQSCQNVRMPLLKVIMSRIDEVRRFFTSERIDLELRFVAASEVFPQPKVFCHHRFQRCMSRVCSATMCFRRRFSSSSCVSRCISLSFMPPYFAFHR